MGLEDKVQELGKLVHDFKKENDKELAEIKARGNTDCLQKELTDKLNNEISKVQEEIKQVHAAMNRTSKGNEQKVAPEMKAAFGKYIRKGSEIAAAEYKALSADSDPDGGMLILPEMSAEIVKKVYESSPIRQLASVQAVSSDSFEIIEDLGEATASWVSETGSRSTNSTPQFNKLSIFVHQLASKLLATQKILDDANINIEAYLSGKVSEQFARSEATSFVTGNGVGKPMGLMSYASGTSFGQVEQVVSGSAAVILADGLMNLFYALKPEYLANASFLMNRATVKSIRKLKGSANDHYMWQPSLALGQPDTLLGKPIYQAADFAVEGANNLVIAFGDIRAAYQIVDRMGIRVLRDPYSNVPYVTYHFDKRVGGGVKNFEAFKIQKCST